MPSRAYLLSLPERAIRSALAFSAGLLREISEVAVPSSVRRGQLYKNLVDTTLRYVIEEVGAVKGVYPTESPQSQAFLARRGVGHAIELLGLVAFKVSPVWVFAALADLSGLGRRLIPEIARALQEEGLLEKEAHVESVDQLLDGLEKASARLAQTLNVPPIDVASLRREWAEIQTHARGLKPVALPSAKTITSRWGELKDEAARQHRSIFETSSLMAIAAVRRLPARVRWLSWSTRVGARRTRKLLSDVILDDYSHTLQELREVGYGAYAKRQLSPYLRACVEHFSRQRSTLTERLIERTRKH
jgi:hypothetical protein